MQRKYEPYNLHSDLSTPPLCSLSKFLMIYASTGNNNEHSTIVFLDVAEVFDKTWHEGLLYEISLLNIPAILIKIVKSFLLFAVKMDGHISSIKSIDAGLPQGSCLPPTLFNLYRNDMPVYFQFQVSFFADDTMFSFKDAYANFAAFQS